MYNSPDFRQKFDFLLLVTKKPYMQCMGLKIAPVCQLDKLYIRTKFDKNPKGSCKFCVEMAWNIPVTYE